MGYPNPLGGVTRQLNKYTTIHSTKFTRNNTFNFGNRTAIINVPETNKLVIWSSIPVGTELQKAIDVATDNEASKFEVFAAIIPDIEHTMAAIDLKKVYPSIFLIGPSGIKDKPDLKLDYEFKDSEANVVVKGTSVLPELANLDFVFLNGHHNRELITYDQNTNTLFEADLLFNIPWNGKNEDQYPSVNQNKGLAGFITGLLNPDSFIGRILLKRLIPATSNSKKGIRAIYNEFSFDSIVLSHGCVIEKDAKKKFKQVFGSYL